MALTWRRVTDGSRTERWRSTWSLKSGNDNGERFGRGKDMRLEVMPDGKNLRVDLCEPTDERDWRVIARWQANGGHSIRQLVARIELLFLKSKQRHTLEAVERVLDGIPDLARDGRD